MGRCAAGPLDLGDLEAAALRRLGEGLGLEEPGANADVLFANGCR